MGALSPPRLFFRVRGRKLHPAVSALHTLSQESREPVFDVQVTVYIDVKIHVFVEGSDTNEEAGIDFTRSTAQSLLRKMNIMHTVIISM